MTLIFAEPEIESILQSYPLDSLHQSNDSVYALRADLTLVYVNSGWSRFASENGGSAIPDRWPLGSSILDAIPAVLRPFFADNFARCLNSNSPWQHLYECSSPQVFREFQMIAYPLGNRQGFLVVNSLFRSAMHSQSGRAPLEEDCRQENGMITQCAHCRRTKRLLEESTWDWVKSCPDRTSHGLCEPCFGYFYPENMPMLHGFPEIFSTGQ